MLYLAQTDTTAGFLSKDEREINKAKGRALQTPCILTMSSLKELASLVRVPKAHKNLVRKAKKTSFIYKKARANENSLNLRGELVDFVGENLGRKGNFKANSKQNDLNACNFKANSKQNTLGAFEVETNSNQKANSNENSLGVCEFRVNSRQKENLKGEFKANPNQNTLNSCDFKATSNQNDLNACEFKANLEKNTLKPCESNKPLNATLKDKPLQMSATNGFLACRVVKDCAHAEFLREFGAFFSSSANLHGQAFSEQIARQITLQNGGQIIDESLFSGAPSALIKLYRHKKVKIR
mgnify:CR=1 FL=1